MENTGNFEASVINFNSCNPECKKQLDCALKEQKLSRNYVRRAERRIDEKDRIIAEKDILIKQLICSYNELLKQHHELLSKKERELNSDNQLILWGNV